MEPGEVEVLSQPMFMDSGEVFTQKDTELVSTKGATKRRSKLEDREQQDTSDVILSVPGRKTRSRNVAKPSDFIESEAKTAKGKKQSKVSDKKIAKPKARATKSTLKKISPKSIRGPRKGKAMVRQNKDGEERELKLLGKSGGGDSSDEEETNRRMK